MTEPTQPVDFLAVAAKYYRDAFGFSPIPVKMPEKIPMLPEGFKEIYTKMRPTDKELAQWFPPNPREDLGIAILITDGYVVDDIDDKALWPLMHSKSPEEKAKETLVHETPRGYRTFYKCPAGIIKSKAKADFPGNHRSIELKPAGAGYVVVPPTKGYERLSPSAFQTIQTLTEEEARILLEAINLFGRHAKLIDESMKSWTEGRRQNMVGPLAGYLRKVLKFKREEAVEVIEAICRLAGDTEIKQRLGYVDATYKKKLNEIAGWSALKEFLPYLKDEKPSQEVTKKEEGTESQKLPPEIEAEIEEEIGRIQGAENQLQALNSHLENVYVGEGENKQAIFVLDTGSKCKEPEFKQIIVLKSSTGAGKSSMMRALAIGYKVKDVGRFSNHALDYSDLRDFEILALKEIGSMDMEKQGVSTLKFLSSDDQGYTVEITARDEETGRFRTEQYRIPCMTVISTTTRLSLDPQFERRSWTFNLDESEGQTKRVAEWKARLQMQNNEKLLGLRKITDYGFSKEVIARFNQRLQPQKIVITFPKAISEIWGFKVLRIRGDIDKVYTFLKLYGSLNTKRLIVLGEGIYALTPEVALEALDIIDRPFASMISRLDERMKEIFDALKKTVEVIDEEDTATGEMHEKERTFDKKGAQIDNKLRSKIALQLGKNEEAIRRRFRFLVDSGFCSDDEKKPKTYTLLYDVEEIEEKISGILRNSELRNSLSQKMQEEGQIFLKRLLRVPTFVDGKASEQKELGTSRPNPSAEVGTRNPIPDKKQGDNDKLGLNNCAISECAKIQDEAPVTDVTHVTDYLTGGGGLTGGKGAKTIDFSQPSTPDTNVPPVIGSVTSVTSVTLEKVIGTREMMEAVLHLVDIGITDLDELESSCLEIGIVHDVFRHLITQMIREGLLVKTDDEKGVQRTGPKLPIDESRKGGGL